MDNFFIEGVLTKESFEKQSDSTMPAIDAPGLTGPDFFYAGSVQHQSPDPEINPDGFSRNYNMERMRNQHPFMQIDPPMTTVETVVLQFSDPEVQVKIPMSAKMYRVTIYSGSLLSGIAIAHRRGIQSSIGSSGSEKNVLVNPEPIWRACHGGGELTIKNIGTANRSAVSVEFWYQM